MCLFSISVTFEMRTVFHKSCLFNDNRFIQDKSYIYQNREKGEESKVAERPREKEGESVSVGGQQE